MSIEACLDEAVNAGEIERSDAAELVREYNRFFAKRSDAGAGGAAEGAKADLVDLIRATTAHKKKQAVLAAKARERVFTDLMEHRNAKGEADVGAAAVLIMEHFGEAKFPSLELSKSAIVGRSHASMEEMLMHFERTAIAGDLRRKNHADMPKVVSELFGVDSGSPKAGELAKAFKDEAERLRLRFNEAGGAIGKLDNWGLPQVHDARAMLSAGLETWKKNILPKLDLDKMRHPLTGQSIGLDEIDDILSGIWDDVVTQGWNKREPTAQKFGKGAMANQRAEHRFLVFRSPDEWMSYQQDFGAPDVFSTMMGHINMMARDIAAMERFGPNPNSMLEMVKQVVEREATLKATGKGGAFAGKAKRAPDRARGKIKRVDDLWAAYSGALETPVNARVADTFGAARNVVTASVMGGASISAVSDVGTQVIARKFAGIDSQNIVGETIKQFSSSNRREAVAAGLIHDAAQNTFSQQARYVGSFDGPRWSSYLGDRVLTFSGLTPWTQAGRHAFGMAMQHEFSRRVDLPLSELPNALADTLDRWGLADDWDTIRKAGLHKAERGVKFLRPNEIAGLDEKLAEKYLTMVLGETEFAVPTGAIRAKTALVNTDRPGTMMGEVKRSFAQFKSFGVVFSILHGLRVHNQIAGGNVGRGAAYAGSLAISMTMFGALAMQLKQVAAGRDPREMKSKEFWGAAFLQGGGLGIYGDFLFADVNRYGGGFSTTLGGPLLQRVDDFQNLTLGNAIEFIQGKDTKAGRELVRFLRGNTPGGTIFWMRMAYERVLLDQLQHLIDPKAGKAFKNRQQYWQRNSDQEFFWKPGQATPDRLPDLTAAF